MAKLLASGVGLGWSVHWILSDVHLDVKVYATAVDLQSVAEQLHVQSTEAEDFEWRSLGVIGICCVRILVDVVRSSTFSSSALRSGRLMLLIAEDMLVVVEVS